MRAKIQRRKKALIPVDDHGRRISQSVLIEASARFMLRSNMNRRLERVETLPIQRRSVERAMLAVEDKVVKAMWVMQRSEDSEGRVFYHSRHGIEYLRERVDHFMAGQWINDAPRPAIPEGKQIDEATAVQGWLSFLEPTPARVLTIGAMSKRGDVGRRVSWIRVRTRLPEFRDTPQRTLQHIYTSALREIVARLTDQRMSA